MFELHNERIVHCDLKPSNILVTWDGHIAVADFGISLTPDSDSCESGEDTPFDQCVFYAEGGTYAYQAPELLIKHSKASFTCAVDMWSLGVVIYEMYTGKVSPTNSDTPCQMSDVVARTSSRPRPMECATRFGDGIYPRSSTAKSMTSSRRTW